MVKEVGNGKGFSPANNFSRSTQLRLPARRPGGTSKSVSRVLEVPAAVLALLLAIWYPIRAWAMNWGATDEEVQAQLPGDEAMTHPISVSTRAVTINAPASAIWPWIVQLGYKRAGWYSYDWIEWLLGCKDYVEGRSATRIHPELQQVKLGDTICTASGVCAPIIHLKPNRYLVLGASWAFVLQTIDAQRTRFIVRTRHGGFFDHSRPFLGGVLYAVDRFLALPFYEPGLHFVMERKMMLGIKERAVRMVTSQARRAERP